jgi:hypothetical protein
VQFDNAEAFFSSSLIGGTTRCSWCGEETGCSIERMRFDVRSEGRTGTYVEGKKAQAKK